MAASKSVQTAAHADAADATCGFGAGGDCVATGAGGGVAGDGSAICGRGAAGGDGGGDGSGGNHVGAA